MKIKRTRDILDAVILFHKNLSEFYDTLGGHSHKHRIRMLLDYMARHEKNLMLAIEDYEKNASQSIMDCWIQFSPDTPDHVPCETMDIHGDMSPEEVIQMALEFDDCITHLFEEVLHSTEKPEIKEVFKNLLKLEHSSLKKMAMDSLMMADI